MLEIEFGNATYNFHRRMFRLSDLQMVTSLEQLAALPDGKTLINTINAYSYCMAQKDVSFSKALKDNVLIPDGMSIVWACKFLKAKSKPLRRIAGYDLFELEMDKLNSNALATSRKKVMFVGSSEKVLSMIKERARIDYPNLEVFVYSPPYKSIFNAEDNAKIIDAINQVAPDLLWIGMTAPKQEKWAVEHWNKLNVSCHVGSIGAVFDFYAGTVKRAPKVWQNCGLEWLYRLITNPKRLWRRYVFGNIKFIYYILKEKLLLQ